MYLATKSFVLMAVNTFHIDFSHIFNILGDIKVKSRIMLYHIISQSADECDINICKLETNMEHLPRYS
jgi:hypothetical protein